MAFSYLIQGKNIVIVIGSTTHTISSSHISYDKIKDAIKANDWDTVQDLVEPKKVVLNYGQGNVEVQGDKLFWKGKEFHNYLAAKFIEMYQEGFPVEPMVAFMENLMQNPSKRAVDELYAFLEKGNLPITADGHFLAYKKIRNDYKDIHSVLWITQLVKLLKWNATKSMTTRTVLAQQAYTSAARTICNTSVVVTAAQ